MKNLFLKFGFLLCVLFMYCTANAATQFYNMQKVRIFSSSRTCRANSICVNINDILLYDNQFSFERIFISSSDMREIRAYRDYLEKILKKNLSCSSIKGKYNLEVWFSPPPWRGHRILRSSGNAQVDKWAMDAIDEAGPYKYFEYYNNNVRFKIDLQYYCK